ncbi:MAG: Pr6Pr family membrane protein [Actinobacteria bacterium]|nr:Pr6Pr family membrane protein [Actinomycetota bacterium]
MPRNLDTTGKRLRVIRLGMALLIAVAIVAQLASSNGRPGFDMFNFFSYFTIISNVVVCVLLALLAARPNRINDPRFAVFRGAATLYMAITGIVYAVLLAPIGADVDVTLPWVDSILHVIAPLWVVADWVIDPPRQPLRRNVFGVWLLFPALYLVYSLIRGAIVSWYPYPFLDPEEAGGYLAVAGVSLGVFVLTLALAALLRWWPDHLQRWVSIVGT